MRENLDQFKERIIRVWGKLRKEGLEQNKLKADFVDQMIIKNFSGLSIEKLNSIMLWFQELAPEVNRKAENEYWNMDMKHIQDIIESRSIGGTDPWDYYD